MFELASINYLNLDGTNVGCIENAMAMFSGAKINTLDLIGLNFRDNVNCEHMFNRCTCLMVQLNEKAFKILKDKSAFKGCSAQFTFK